MRYFSDKTRRQQRRLKTFLMLSAIVLAVSLTMSLSFVSTSRVRMCVSTVLLSGSGVSLLSPSPPTVTTSISTPFASAVNALWSSFSAFGVTGSLSFFPPFQITWVSAFASETTDTLYVPELVEPTMEAEPEEEVLLEEGPEIRIRFGDSLKEFFLTHEEELGYFSVVPWASFDRVDGLTLALIEEYNAPGTLYPYLRLSEGYAFDGRYWRYRFDFEQPLFSPSSFSLGTSVYLITDTFDKELLSTEENTLAGLFMKKDYRDYFEREGASVLGRYRFLKFSSAKVEYSEETHRSLKTKSKGFFFRHSREFRENPPVDEGKWASFIASYELDTQKDYDIHPTEYWYRLQYERTHRKTDPCWEYTRLSADLRTYWRLSPGQYLSSRVMLGATPAGNLPFQKQFCVGGIGTLSAHEYKEYRGDHMILLNLEYAVDIVKRFQFLLLLDAGKAWFGRNALKDQTLELDVGIGIGRQEGPRLFVAKNPRGEGSDLAWVLRLQRPF